MHLIKGLRSIYHYITIGKSKANGQVEQTTSMLKDCIYLGLIKKPASFWMGHLASELLLFCMIASQMIGIV